MSNVVDLSFLDVLQIVMKLLPFGLEEINFSGREPTLRQDLPSIIKWCAENNLRVNITTNGTVLDHKGYETLLKAGLNMLVFSVDGVSANTHDKIRGTGNFYKTIDSIKYCSNYIAKLNKPIKTGISCTLQKYNIQELPGIISMCDSLGIDFLGINPVSICGEASSVKELLYLFAEEILTCWEKICKEFNEVKPNYELYLGTFPMEAKFLNLKYNLDLPVIQTGCSAGKTIYIDPYGKALPCYMLPPVANNMPEIRQYLRYWQILVDPISKAAQYFEPFISFANSYSQKNNENCRQCPDVDVCRRCPLIALSDPDAIYRCQIAQRQISSFSIDNSNKIIPAKKNYITWSIDGNILLLSLKKGDFTSEKKFEITPFIKSVWTEIDGVHPLEKIESRLQAKWPNLSTEKINKNLLYTIDYFWKEGIISIK